MMETKQKIDQERLDELRSVLGKIPGSQRLAWHLEVYELRDGVDVLADIINIKTGRSIKRSREQEIEHQVAPG